MTRTRTSEGGVPNELIAELSFIVSV